MKSLYVTAFITLLTLATNAKGLDLKKRVISADNTQRSWYEYVPSQCRKNIGGGCPLLVFLHGSNVTAERTEETFLFSEIAEREKFIVVYPQSLKNPLGGGRPATWPTEWVTYSNAYTNPSSAVPNDVLFLRNVIRTVSARFAVNPKKIYMAGYSSGGQMTATFAGNGLSNMLAAISIYKAGWTNSRPVPGTSTCYDELSADANRHYMRMQRTCLPVQMWRGNDEEATTGVSPCIKSRVDQDANQRQFWLYFNRVASLTPVTSSEGVLGTSNGVRTWQTSSYGLGAPYSQCRFDYILSIGEGHLPQVPNGKTWSERIWRFLSGFSRP